MSLTHCVFYCVSVTMTVSVIVAVNNSSVVCHKISKIFCEFEMCIIYVTLNLMIFVVLTLSPTLLLKFYIYIYVHDDTMSHSQAMTV